MWLLTDIYSSISKIIATNFQEMSLRPKTPTDPKKSGPTLNLFSKKIQFFVSQFKFARKLSKNG